MIRTYVFDLFILLTSGFALWRGGGPERIVGGSFLAAYAATLASYSPLAVRFYGVEGSVFAIDLVLLLALVVVAVKADRGWPLVVAALQLNTVGAHVVKVISPDTIRVTYALLIAVWSWPTQLILALGTWRHTRRLAAVGWDRSWSLPITEQPRP